ncbi:MAG: serpin [Bacteroidetes bacterium]|nr:MAG: serpin [Bacteroidota bacterium]
MKTQILLLVFIIATSLLTGCKKDKTSVPTEPKPIEMPEKGSQIISASNDFGIEMFRQVSLVEPDNLMLSPLSASSALSMLLNGCDGETFSQISSMLGYEDLTAEEINSLYKSLVTQLLDADPQVNLALANAIWYRQGFQVKTEFLNTMQTSFDATTEALDFNSPQAVTTINNWASDNTNGKIPKVMDQISADAVMFLMNALYFKGNWTNTFDKSKTSLQPFNPDGQNPVMVDMMQAKFNFRQIIGQGYRALELPYGRQNFAMVLVLPDAGLEGFISGFNGDQWLEITSALDGATPFSTELYMPKFKFSYEKLLNDQLKAMGMLDAFDAYMADLSGIADADLFVSFVKQNTFVDVNEEGTEAAAVTTIGVDVTSLPEPLIINKPFVFAIRERMTNSLLFIGKVELPEY